MMEDVEVFFGTLPSGKSTSSSGLYVGEWRRFAEPLRAALNAQIYSFDPGVSFRFNGRVINFDFDVVRELNRILPPHK